MSCYKKAGRKHSIKIMNRSFEGMAEFKYLGTILTDQNCMNKEIKSSLNSGNACYHSVQSLSSRLLSRNVKVKIYKTIIQLLDLYGCETWSVTLREECRLRVFKNMVLRRVLFEPKRDEVTGGWQKLHSEEHHVLYSFPNIIRQIKSRRMRWVGRSTHGRVEESVQGSGVKAQRKETTWKTRHILEDVIKWILGRLAGGCRVAPVGSG
jgi:hypothetical protein